MTLRSRLLLGAFALFPHILSAVEIVAHRGASHDAPENTLASFNLAWKQKADVVELDIHPTSDGRIVAMHDRTTKRTAGVDRAVAAQSFAELRALDAGSWKDVKWKGERIPELAEILSTAPSGGRFFIEIKSGAEVLPELEKVLRAAGDRARGAELIGFHFETMKLAREKMPHVPCYWVVASSRDKKTGAVPSVDELVRRAKEAGFDGLDLHFGFPIDAAFVRAVKAAGLKLYVWTVNDAEVAQRLAAAGVDGITTDRPGWLREQLAAGSGR